MAKEIAAENGRISNLKGSRPWPWIGSYCIPSCITHRPPPTCQISLKWKKTFCGRTDVRMYARTYVRTDGHLRPALLGRLCRRVDLNTNWKEVLQNNCYYYYYYYYYSYKYLAKSLVKEYKNSYKYESRYNSRQKQLRQSKSKAKAQVNQLETKQSINCPLHGTVYLNES